MTKKEYFQKSFRPLPGILIFNGYDAIHIIEIYANDVSVPFRGF